MQIILTYLDSILQLMKTPMQIYEYNFSFWNVFLFSILGVILARFIGFILDL